MHRTQSAEILNQPGLRIYVEHGWEGPKHDPYSVEVFAVRRRNTEVSLRQGLTVAFTVKKFTDAGKPLMGCELAKANNEAEMLKRANAAFKQHTGASYDEWLDAVEKLMKHRSRVCPKCGSHALGNYEGFPGETLFGCQDCGHVISGSMNWSAIE